MTRLLFIHSCLFVALILLVSATAACSQEPAVQATPPNDPSWHRPQDKVALAVVSNAIKRDHQNYLRLGGLGFILGHGNLNCGRETIVESY